MWQEKLKEFEKVVRPIVDQSDCVWSYESRLVLTNRFIEAMGLAELHEKWMDIKAADELAEQLFDEIEEDEER